MEGHGRQIKHWECTDWGERLCLICLFIPCTCKKMGGMEGAQRVSVQRSEEELDSVSTEAHEQEHNEKRVNITLHKHSLWDVTKMSSVSPTVPLMFFLIEA